MAIKEIAVMGVEGRGDTEIHLLLMFNADDMVMTWFKEYFLVD